MRRLRLAAGQEGHPLKLVRSLRRLDDAAQLDDGPEGNLPEGRPLLTNVGEHRLALLGRQADLRQHFRVPNDTSQPRHKRLLRAEIQVKIQRPTQQGLQMRTQLRVHRAIEVHVRHEDDGTLKLKGLRQILAVLVLERLLRVPRHRPLLRGIERRLEQIESRLVAEHAVTVVKQEHVARLAVLIQQPIEARRPRKAAHRGIAEVAPERAIEHRALFRRRGEHLLNGVRLADARIPADDDGAEVPVDHAARDVLQRIEPHPQLLLDFLVGQLDGSLDSGVGRLWSVRQRVDRIPATHDAGQLREVDTLLAAIERQVTAADGGAILRGQEGEVVREIVRHVVYSRRIVEYSQYADAMSAFAAL